MLPRYVIIYLNIKAFLLVLSKYTNFYLHFYEGTTKQILHFYEGITKQILHFYEGTLYCRDIPSIFCVQFITHTILDVVVDDEVEFFFREAVMLGKDFIDFVDDGV